jgi:hypothetical protein
VISAALGERSQLPKGAEVGSLFGDQLGNEAMLLA